MKQEIIITTITESVKSSEMTDRDKAFYNEGIEDGSRAAKHVALIIGIVWGVILSSSQGRF